jgi:polar amino acid transport system permease protein
MEVMSRTRAIATVTHQPLPLSILAGLIFFAMTWVGVKSLRLLEKKVRIPGYSH